MKRKEEEEHDKITSNKEQRQNINHIYLNMGMEKKQINCQGRGKGERPSGREERRGRQAEKVEAAVRGQIAGKICRNQDKREFNVIRMDLVTTRRTRSLYRGSSRSKISASLTALSSD